MKKQEYSGFTLIEMVVVMTIMGLIAALVTPSLQGMHASLQRSLWKDQLVAVFNDLPLQVVRSGRSVWLESSSVSREQLPERFVQSIEELGATFSVSPAVLITAHGFCPQGGVVKVVKNGVEYVGKISSPSCRWSS